MNGPGRHPFEARFARTSEAVILSCASAVSIANDESTVIPCDY